MTDRRWSEVDVLAPSDVLVQARVAEAEAMVGGLAVPGTGAHGALRALLAGLDGDGPVDGAVLEAGLRALGQQAQVCLRAGQHALAQLRAADEDPHWSTGTAHEWQRYLRWLVSILDRVAVPDGSTTAAVGAVGDGCARAREVWGAVAGRTPDLVGARHGLETVVVDGRTYVSVTGLAGSLRSRAGAFADAAAASARADDALGALVAEELAGELAARADALDLAGIEQAGLAVDPVDPVDTGSAGDPVDPVDPGDPREPDGADPLTPR